MEYIERPNYTFKSLRHLLKDMAREDKALPKARVCSTCGNKVGTEHHSLCKKCYDRSKYREDKAL